MGCGSQFGLLLWKNWLLQRNKKVLTFFEIAIPTFAAILLFGTKQLTEYEQITTPTTWDPFTVDSFSPLLQSPSRQQCRNVTAPCYRASRWRIAYTPNNTAMWNVMTEIATKLDVIVVGMGFQDEKTLQDFLILEENIPLNSLGGIVVTSAFPTESTFPDKVTYKIRLKSNQQVGGGGFTNGNSEWLTGFQFDTNRFRLGPRRKNDIYGGNPGYYVEGFLQLQQAFDNAIIRQHNSSADINEVSVQLQRFPYPPYTNDIFIVVIGVQLPLLVMLSFLVLAPNIVKDVVLEKERKLKESMKLMGLSNWLHWLAWFIKYFIFLTISSLIMTIFFKINLGSGAVITQTDGSLVFITLLFYSISTIMFCFAVSVFFSKANTGAAAGGILFFLSYVPYFVIPNSYDNMTLGTKLLSCLLPNIAMAMGFNLISQSEVTGVGIQWNNLATPVNIDDPLTLGHCLFFLILDSLIALLITWYVDAVHPGEFGVPKPFYFCCTKWYWCGGERGGNDDEEMLTEKVNNGEYFEPRATNVRAGIQIKGLRKEFKKKVAVENLYLDMQEDQITALLGHNGAGKTTTMFMLTGFIPPTKGTALIDGYNIRTNIEKVRSSLGMCPQHDVLFDDLTVAEHLEFFDKLKGRSGKEVQEDIDEMIKLLHLEDKRNKPSKSLSGGMKRKLSVGIALIGGSKIVILDEPTSGMDPEARRQMWDILQSQRAGRTILLTTHFMDEADYLGDRIAIMSSGKLVCCGSSLFLKKKYGVGYHMVMVKEPSCNVDQVEQIILKHVPDAKMESNISAELAFVLPHESSDKFEELFTALETNRKSLGIASFGASVTTMEEVFLKVGEGENEDLESKLVNRPTENGNGYENPSFNNGGEVEMASVKNGSANKVSPVGTPDVTMDVVTNGNNRKGAPVLGVQFHRNTGVSLYLQQFWGMFLKRFINSWRSPVVTIVQLLIPMMFALLSCLIIRTSTSKTDPAPLTLSFSYFQTPVVPYTKVNNSTNVDLSVEKFKEFLANNVTLDSVGNPATNDSLENYLVDQGETNKRDYINSYIVAGYFEGLAGNVTQMITGLFHNEALHSPGLALNVVGNTLLRYFTNSAKSIEVTNHPLPKPASFDATEDITSSFATAFVVSIMVAFGMSFLVATFVVFAIKERAVKAKHCQFVSGVHTSNFWFSAFTWDMVNFLLPTFGIMILFVAFDITGYIQENNLAYVFLTFLLYGASILPFVYIMSFAFNVPASGYVWLTMINVFTGMTALILIFVLKSIPETVDVANALEWIFYVFLPNYCFANGIQNIFFNYQAKSTCENVVKAINENSAGTQFANVTLEQFCSLLVLSGSDIENPCCPEKCGTSCAEYHDNYLAWDFPGIGKPIIFMLIQFIGFFALLFFFESGMAKNITQKIIAGTRQSEIKKEETLQRMDSLTSPTHQVEDSDVYDEKQRLLTTDINDLMNTDSLILNQVVKFYGDFLAVNHLTVGIKKGECFGLLGVNGAGKTTTFKMLTGDETITGGKAYLDGYSVAADIKEVQQRVGYCPQFDALIDKLTVAETISMYARLRGVRQADIKGVVKNLITNLLLDEYENKQAGSLSGGNKRKLSTAIALVGDPPIVFLDEPTTGMDPVARRLLWNTLTQVRESGRTLVLTSHSMEECEALCTRIAIMVNGQFKCLGTCQKLKNKFGEGYTLMAKITPGESHEETESRTESLIEFIDKEFPGSKIKDLHQGLVMYQINDNNLSWARIFGTMEKAKETYFIEDYSVSQTTLEQVFINFARAQLPALEESIMCSAKCKSCCCFFCCCGCCKS